jgi:lipopolysaccharide/colanic/teichoic acid biosynthesis glycosyltransferase
MRWYLDWSAEGGRTIHLLVPNDLTSPDYEFWSSTAPGKVIRYHDEGDVILPRPRRRGHTFIINGNQFPIVQWRRALASAQRQSTDVVVFGPSGALTGVDCPETVLIDADAQVIRFKRHYDDSPGFADRWSGHAAFLVVRSEHAQAVAAHIVVRGWGLDSIGALVRRFGVRWLTDHSVLSDDPLTEDSGGLLAGRMTRWPIPASLPEKRGASDAPDSRNHGIAPWSASQQDGPWVAEKGMHAGPSAETSVDGRPQGSENASGEFTIATDDLPGTNDSRGYLAAKRALDIVASAAGLVVLSPLLLVVAILVKLTSRGPVLYAHTRQGLGGKEFPCLKFRSMRTGADAIQAQLRARNEVDGPQFKMAQDPRVTRLGHWLRKTNVDELPQLLNVLVGHMSLVGPRPSPDQENQYCPAWRRARLSTRPGITGLWQVLRNREECASDFQEWIYYDVEYARHRSFWLDLQILFYTPLALWAPRRVAPFAARLERADICAHSDKMIYKPA